MIALIFFLAGICLICAFSCAQESEGNAVIENIMSRRSIRQYKEGPVARDTMQVILECGINAPNAINKQSWEVRVVDDPAVMDELQGYMLAAAPSNMKPEMVKGCFRGAPTMVIIANDVNFRFSPVDCGLLSENIMLSAWSIGVGSVCLGSPVDFIKNSPEAMARLGFSEGYEPIICIGLGYPAESPEAKPRDFGKVKFVE